MRNQAAPKFRLLPLKPLVRHVEAILSEYSGIMHCGVLDSIIHDVIRVQHGELLTDRYQLNELKRRVASCFTLGPYTDFLVENIEPAGSDYLQGENLKRRLFLLSFHIRKQIAALGKIFSPEEMVNFFIEVIGRSLEDTEYFHPDHTEREIGLIRMGDGARTAVDVFESITKITPDCLTDAGIEVTDTSIQEALSNSRRVYGQIAMEQNIQFDPGGAYFGRLPLSCREVEGSIVWTLNKPDRVENRLWTGCPAHLNLSAARATITMFDFLLPHFVKCAVA